MHPLGTILCGVALAGAAYAAAAAALVGRLTGRPRAASEGQPAVSILKPLSGAPRGLTKALASTLAQHYSGRLQVVFGLHDPADPAAEVAEQIRATHPEADITIVAGGPILGVNRKVSNLAHMLSAAKHDVLLLSDADIQVPHDWIAEAVHALAEAEVGAVSFFYSGEGRSTWARFCAMGISYHFLPNAIFGAATGLAHPCFGSTIALSRQTLAEIGGLERFANVLADDYEIGRAIREKGYRLAYPPLLVKHLCGEQSLHELWRHELRWARTIRIIDPLGCWGSIVTHALPLGLIGAALLGFSPVSLVILATVAAARLFLKYRIDHIAGGAAGPGWLLPLRDMLSFVVFLASLTGREVDWQGERLKIGARGAIL